MNILFTSSTPFHPLRGGVGRVTDTLCKAFLSKGHKVFYLHHKWSDNDNKNYHYPVPTDVLPNQDKDIQLSHAFYIDYLKQRQIDIVICQDALFDLTFHRTEDLPVKVISVIHNNPLLDYNVLWNQFVTLRNDKIVEKLKRIARCCIYLKAKKKMWKRTVLHFNELYQLSDKILLLSPQYLPSLRKMDEKFLSKTEYIYNPNTYPLQLNLPKNKKKEIIFVGRCFYVKRIDRLLKIWNSLWKKHPEWKFTIVGDGPEKEHLDRLAHKMKLENIEFVGFQDPQTYYKRASIICMTSNFEGFPMTLVEAMQFGCVPIAFDSFEAVNDIILPKKTGELAKSFDLKKFENKLTKLLDDENYRSVLSKNAFEHVKQFDISNIVEEWERIFKAL